MSLETHVIAGFQPSEGNTSRSSFRKQKESATHDYDSGSEKGLLGVGWSLGNPLLRGTTSIEIVANNPYCRGDLFPGGSGPNEIRFFCAGPTHRVSPRMGGRLELDHIGIEAGMGVPYSRLVFKRGIASPLDSTLARPTERFTAYRPGWSLHVAATTNYLGRAIPSFGLAYRVEQYQYDAFGGGRITEHTLALYSYSSYRDLTERWGTGHSTPGVLAIAPYLVAPIVMVVIMARNALCNPQTNPTC